MKAAGGGRLTFALAAASPEAVTEPLVLRDLDGSFGFESLLAPNINLDLFGLGFSLLGEADLQHAVVIVGAHLSRIDGTGQRERAGEGSVVPLDATEVFLFFFLL